MVAGDLLRSSKAEVTDNSSLNGKEDMGRIEKSMLSCSSTLHGFKARRLRVKRLTACNAIEESEPMSK